MLDLVHDEGGLDGADGVDRAEDVDDEFVVVFHVGGVDLQQVDELAGDVVALGDLGDVLDDPYEVHRHVPAHLLELDGAEDLEAEVEFFGVEDGDIFEDVAVPFEAFEPLEDRGGGEVNAGGELFGRQAGVFLQQAQEFEVGFVEGGGIHGIKFYGMPVEGSELFYYFCNLMQK